MDKEFWRRLSARIGAAIEEIEAMDEELTDAHGFDDRPGKPEGIVWNRSIDLLDAALTCLIEAREKIDKYMKDRK